MQNINAYEQPLKMTKVMSDNSPIAESLNNCFSDIFKELKMLLWIDERYEIVQQTNHRLLGIDEVYKIGDGWNVQNWLQN